MTDVVIGERNATPIFTILWWDKGSEGTYGTSGKAWQRAAIVDKIMVASNESLITISAATNTVDKGWMSSNLSTDLD